MSALLIGVGNRLRRDDGAGLALVERLERGAPAECLALEHVPPELFERWEGRASVVLVDASSSGDEPGTIRRFEVEDAPLPASSLRLSTHGFGLHEALELARALGKLPARVTVYAIEGEDFGEGPGLSAPVERAVATLAARLRAELAEG